jgi:hypothetical protein
VLKGEIKSLATKIYFLKLWADSVNVIRSDVLVLREFQLWPPLPLYRTGR